MKLGDIMYRIFYAVFILYIFCGLECAIAASEKDIISIDDTLSVVDRALLYKDKLKPTNDYCDLNRDGVVNDVDIELLWEYVQGFRILDDKGILAAETIRGQISYFDVVNLYNKIGLKVPELRRSVLPDGWYRIVPMYNDDMALSVGHSSENEQDAAKSYMYYFEKYVGADYQKFYIKSYENKWYTITDAYHNKKASILYKKFDSFDNWLLYAGSDISTNNKEFDSQLFGFLKIGDCYYIEPKLLEGAALRAPDNRRWSDFIGLTNSKAQKYKFIPLTISQIVESEKRLDNTHMEKVSADIVDGTYEILNTSSHKILYVSGDNEEYASDWNGAYYYPHDYQNTNIILKPYKVNKTQTCEIKKVDQQYYTIKIKDKLLFIEDIINEKNVTSGTSSVTDRSLWKFIKTENGYFIEPKNIPGMTISCYNENMIDYSNILLRKQENVKWKKWDIIEPYSNKADVDMIYVVSTPCQNLLLRKAANNKSEVIAKMPKGSKVIVTSIDNNGWASVEFQGQKGYAFAKFLTKGE